MTEELQKLFDQKQRAYQQYQAMQMMNTFGRKPEELISMDIAMESAKQDWLAAHSEYQSALEKHVKETRK